jgi:hypothetical protein
MMTVTLFDEFERTNPSPAGYEEDRFSFLNRVDQPFWQRIREELERWYADYPDEEHGFGLRARFRSAAASQHFGSWWELYLHRLFRCLGFYVAVEPDVVGGKPDFRMTRDSDSFLVEATTSFSGIVDEERHPEREAAILAAIDKAQNPNFFVRVEFEKVGDEQPKVREIVEPLECWLGGLDPDDVLQRGYFDAPQLPLPVRGWELLFTAFGVRPEARGRPDHRLLGMPPGMSGYVNNRDKLAAALGRKGGKYTPNEPLVLAVLLMSDGTVRHEDIEAALLGPIAYPVDPDKPGLGPPLRQRNGFWIRGTQPRGTRVSAVLTGNNIIPETVARTWPRLWPNPWASRPLMVSLPFPRGVASERGAVVYEEGVGAPHSILGLPEDWPGPGEAFTEPWSAHGGHRNT